MNSVDVSDAPVTVRLSTMKAGQIGINDIGQVIMRNNAGGSEGVSETGYGMDLASGQLIFGDHQVILTRGVVTIKELP